MRLPARVGLALLALVVAGAFAVELRAHLLLESARDRAGRVGQRSLASDTLRDVLDDIDSAGDFRPGTDALVLGARVEVTAGRTERAVSLARRAVAREPESYLAWAVLTFVLVSEKDYRAARRALQRAMELNPRALTNG